VFVLFLYEKDLKKAFWNHYKDRKSILKYQFECAAREGGVDLLTIEEYGGEYEICSFEFKLDNMKKAFAQAEANLPFVSKSFVVIPADKEELIQNKYLPYLKEKRYIGVIGVEKGGRWKILHQPYAQRKVLVNQKIISLVLKGF